MADLYHLLDDLQEREEQETRRQRQRQRQREDDDEDDGEDDDMILMEDEDEYVSNKTTKANDDNRRLTVETAVTADMSYYDDDDEEDEDGGGMMGERPAVPEALRRRNADNQDDDGEDGDGGDNNREGGGGGGGIEDLLQEEEFDMIDGRNKSKNKTIRRSHGLVGVEEEGDATNEVELLMADEVYGMVHRRWLEEQHSPELLPYDEELVETIKRTLDTKQDAVDEDASELPNDINVHAAVHLLMTDIRQQDLDRVKFVLADWLNLRLAKLEAYPLHNQHQLLRQNDDEEEETKMMSTLEVEYLTKYWELEKQALEETTTNYLPIEFQDLEEPKMIDQPDTTGYYFWVVQQEPLVLDDEIHVEHSCLIAKYSKMKQHMDNGKVRLLM